MQTVKNEILHSGRFRLTILLTALLSLSILASCGTDQIPLQPVRGKVLYRGKPAAQAYVVFHPENPSEQLQKMRPRAETDAEGSFALTTFVPNDGAPAGDYRVTIRWPGPPPGANPNDPEMVQMGPDRLGERYADPNSSGLRATVVAGEECNLEPFVLQ